MGVCLVGHSTNRLIVYQFDTSRLSCVLYHKFLTMFYTINLPITCYQERLYANNYFELLPVVSAAFKSKIIITFTQGPIS